MTKRKLTTTQREILALVVAEYLEHGIGVTATLIRARTGLASTSIAHAVRTLRLAGYLKSQGYHGAPVAPVCDADGIAVVADIRLESSPSRLCSVACDARQ